MDVVAVNGTNGKSTVSYMVEAARRAGAQARVGVIGTDGCRVAHEPIRVDTTTPTMPEAVELHLILRWGSGRER
ncbi:Mur ligase family protein [Microtetraspora malaysiensis]|uniref:Mur ligase family protein n=1 Tax=Microtetraspora malaysiensis TaxID=161358 RepID=A0ABW6T0A7_9ACTN